MQEMQEVQQIAQELHKLLSEELRIQAINSKTGLMTGFPEVENILTPECHPETRIFPTIFKGTTKTTSNLFYKKK